MKRISGLVLGVLLLLPLASAQSAPKPKPSKFNMTFAVAYATQGGGTCTMLLDSGGVEYTVYAAGWLGCIVWSPGTQLLGRIVGMGGGVQVQYTNDKGKLKTATYQIEQRTMLPAGN